MCRSLGRPGRWRSSSSRSCTARGRARSSSSGSSPGDLVLVAGVRLGRYLAYVPWPVVEGFTVGIAVIIFLQQVPAASAWRLLTARTRPLWRSKRSAGVRPRPRRRPAHGRGGRRRDDPRPTAPPGSAQLAPGRDGGHVAGGSGHLGLPRIGALPRSLPRRPCRRSSSMTSAPCSGRRWPSPCWARLESLLSARWRTAWPTPGSEIPLASLAGVLMVTAVRMVDVPNVRVVRRSTRPDALVLIVTSCATIANDLIVAVEIGLAIAIGARAPQRRGPPAPPSSRCSRTPKSTGTSRQRSGTTTSSRIASTGPCSSAPRSHSSANSPTSATFGW